MRLKEKKKKNFLPNILTKKRLNIIHSFVDNLKNRYIRSIVNKKRYNELNEHIFSSQKIYENR